MSELLKENAALKAELESVNSMNTALAVTIREHQSVIERQEDAYIEELEKHARNMALARERDAVEIERLREELQYPMARVLLDDDEAPLSSLATPVKEGYVLVPLVPTSKMRYEFINTFRHNNFRTAYTALIKAAPNERAYSPTAPDAFKLMWKDKEIEKMIDFKALGYE